MPFNGSGVFNRNFSWTIDAANTIPITATRVDSDTNDIASGLSNCVTRDGQSPAQANLPMGGFKLTNCAVAVLGNEYMTLDQITATYYKISGGTLTGAMTTANISQGLIVPGSIGGMGTSAAAKSGLVVRGLGTGNAAFLEFLQDSYGAYFGVDTDNVLKYGGHSSGATAFRVVHEGLTSVNLPGALAVTTTLTSASFTSGSVTSTGSGAAYTFTDRLNATLGWAWFASGNQAFLNNTALGATLTMNYSTGNTTVVGTWTGPNFIGTSDERLKEDIADFVPRDDLAELVRFVSYVRKASGRHELGVIAQQLQKIAPEYVYEGEDGILGVDKAGLALEVAMGLAIRVRDLEG